MSKMIMTKDVDFEEEIAGIKVYSEETSTNSVKFYFVDENNEVIKILDTFVNYERRVSEYVVDYEFKDAE